MNLLKKSLAVLLIAFSTTLLSGCGGTDEGETTEASTSNLKTYEGGEFTIDIDPSWKIITQSEFFADVPKETLVAFTTPEAYDGFFINVNVVKEDLKQNIAAIDYARANINLASQNLTDYTKVQEAKVNVGTQESLIHIFTARLNPSEKLIRFIQLYGTRDNYGYIVTGGMLQDTPQSLRDLVGNTVTSFKLR